jgi:hypothetical protein
LVFFQGVILVVPAYRAVFPADFTVLFGILYHRFAGVNHDGKRCEMKVNRSIYLEFPEKR